MKSFFKINFKLLTPSTFSQKPSRFFSTFTYTLKKILKKNPSKIRQINFSKNNHHILNNKKGQATVEYILILAFVLFFAGKASKSIIGMLDTGILKVGGRLEKQLKTGRAQLNTWKN